MEKTTNMEKIKELALKHFDASAISVEPKDGFTVDEEEEKTVPYKGCHVTHPVFREGLFPHASSDEGIALRNVMDNPAEFEKAKSKLADDARTQLNSIQTSAEIVVSLKESYRMPFIKEIKQFLSPADYNQALRLTIIDSGIASSPSERAQFKADVLALFDESFVPQLFMWGSEQKQYDALPDVVTVYHGVSEEIEDCEISDIFYWTAEIEQLVPTEDFRAHESDAGIVYEAKIKKENIYAYLAADDTLFLNPDKLFDILHHKTSLWMT